MLFCAKFSNIEFPKFTISDPGVPVWAGERMRREYLEQNVYMALQERLQLIFEEFDNIYISFSGGKDS